MSTYVVLVLVKPNWTACHSGSLCSVLNNHVKASRGHVLADRDNPKTKACSRTKTKAVYFSMASNRWVNEVGNSVFVLNIETRSDSAHTTVYIFNSNVPNPPISRALDGHTCRDDLVIRTKSIGLESGARVKHGVTDLIVLDVHGCILPSRTSVVEAREDGVLNGCTKAHSFVRLDRDAA